MTVVNFPETVKQAHEKGKRLDEIDWDMTLGTPHGTLYQDINGNSGTIEVRPEIVGEAIAARMPISVKTSEAGWSEKEWKDAQADAKNDLARYKDNINPSHYKKGDVEVINLTRRLGFCEGNVVKYVARHKEKGGKEDIIKAMWYLQDILDNDYGC